MNYIYNVTIKVATEIVEDWIQWMKHEHMDEVIETGMFDHYHFFELIEPVDEEGRTFVAQYSTDSPERYKRYIDEFAPALREKGYQRFGDRFIAFRSVMRSC